MMTPHVPSLPKSRSGGISLVIVLASLVFLSALVVAFLVQMGTELRSSKLYAEGASARILSQSATNLVMASIRDATKGVDDSGTTLAWASQPGMIRTYDTSGNPIRCFKLYSDAEMVTAGGFDANATANQIPAGWDASKAIYTDLNEPVYLNSVGRFPIIDADSTSLKELTLNGDKVRSYDGDGDGVPDIDGFYVSTSAPISGKANPNLVPMPVRWLYVLADGQVAAGVPTAHPGEASVPDATSANPIIGRIAFWTDDETCKLNINTASEGTYADYPRANYQPSPANNSWDEQNLANNQPVNGEYQRYPGHPATVSLSTVLKKPSGFTDLQWSETLYQIIPRIKQGGSTGGTVLTTKGQGASVIPLQPDADRIYASVDELLFKPILNGSDRIENQPAVLSSDRLNRSKFFLTAASRSPDVNLFNKPRVCIWPVSSNNTAASRSAFDQLFAFCSTINQSLFYFQRQDSTNGLTDLPAEDNSGLGRNRSLMKYLQYLTNQSIPGFGGSFAAKYDTGNGAGGTDRDQILMEIFDYIRSMNLIDASVTNKFAPGQKLGSNTWISGSGQVIPIEDPASGTRGFGRIRAVQGATLIFIANADGDIAASQPAGAGNQVPAGNMRIQAILIPQLFDPSVGAVFNTPYFRVIIKDLPNLKCNNGGTVSMFSNSKITLTQNSYSKDGAFFGDQYGLSQIVSSLLVGNAIDIPKENGTFSFEGGDIAIEIQTIAGERVQTAVLKFPSGVFPLPSLAPTNVHNYSWDYNPNSVTGPFNMRFFGAPPALAMPNVPSGNDLPGNNTPSLGGRLATAARSNAGAWITGYDVVRSVSVVHGDVRLVAAMKDPPSSAYGPVGAYSSNTAKVLGMHSLWDSNGHPYYGAVAGRMSKGAAYDYLGSTASYYTISKMVYIDGSSSEPGAKKVIPGKPGGSGGQTTGSSAPDTPYNGVAVGKLGDWTSGDLPGDFDNAPGLCRDGPFINKADEGDMGAQSGSSYYIPYINWRGATGYKAISASLFTPNRQIPSAVTFGSLPTGVFANRPWQTLLFRPDPTGLHPGGKDRKGDGTSVPGMPADHLLLDLFNMPVVEPYAISEPLSTAGKINMNYQIVPFTYIKRETGIRAILKSEKVISISESNAGSYKQWSATTPSIRFAVDASQTMKGFDDRFASGDIFRSATEICDLPVVPAGATYAQLSDSSVSKNYWTTSTNGRRLTGDNSKERPYATIYPRLTTKSNTFTIHVKAQSLKKVRGTPVNIWVENRDQVTAEYRGSQTVERYVDPNNADIKDYADPKADDPMSDYYKFRVISTKQFAP